MSGRYRRLLRYGARFRKGWASIVLVTLMSTGAGLLAPLPLKVLIDNVIGDQATPGVLAWLPGAGTDQGLLAWVVVAELAVFALASALDVLLTFLWIVVGQSMVYALARDLFARAQRRAFRAQQREPIGDTMQTVAGDAWAVHTVVDELAFTPAHAVLTSLGLIGGMWAFNPSLTLVAVALAPLMAVFSLLVGRPIRRASHGFRDVQGQLNAHVHQTLSGISVVQAFGQESREVRRFDQLAGQAVINQVRIALASGLNGLGTGLIGAIGTGIVLVIGGHAVLAGSLSAGGLIVFLGYFPQLQRQLAGLTGIYAKLQAVSASTDRVIALLDAPVEVAQRPGAIALERVRGAIGYEDVGFAYEPGRPVLEHITFAAHPGQTIAIVGATGAGKSTLVSLLPRFFDPDHGRITLDGHDLRDLRLDTVRSAVSLVLQDSFLFPVTIAENIAYGRPTATRSEIQDAARAANAHDFITHLPDGYDTTVGERGASLSGGERQRIAIARALLKDAPILILDEPTSALDAHTESLLLQALQRLMAGRTTLIIAHRLSTIRNADHILVLDHGHILEQGTHHQLLTHNATYAHLHHTQFGRPERRFSRRRRLRFLDRLLPQ